MLSRPSHVGTVYLFRHERETLIETHTCTSMKFSHGTIEIWIIAFKLVATLFLCVIGSACTGVEVESLRSNWERLRSVGQWEAHGWNDVLFWRGVCVSVVQRSIAVFVCVSITPSKYLGWPLRLSLCTRRGASQSQAVCLWPRWTPKQYPHVTRTAGATGKN